MKTKLPQYADAEFVKKIVGLPIKYEGEVIGHISEAERSTCAQDEVLCHGIIYNKDYFRDVVEKDCD